MHIVHVLTRLTKGGSEENTMATATWQAQAGHSVTVIHGGAADRLWETRWPAGVERIALPDLVAPLSPRLDWSAQQKLRALYLTMQPDIVHTHQSKAGILGRRAARAVPKARVVHGIHIVNFDHVPRARKALYLTAERHAARATDAFVGVSDAVCDAYVEAGIARSRDVYCVPSGFDLARFRSGEPPQDAADLLGTPDSAARPFCIAMLAALEPRKGHLAFLDSFARWFSGRRDVRLLVCGEGPMRAAIEQVAKTPQLRHSVVMCGHRSDPEAILVLADVSVLASEREGLPRAALQSIAAGTPVVMPNFPGCEAVFTDQGNARLVNRNAPDALCAALSGLETERPMLRKLSVGARATDLRDWEEDRLGRDTTAIYETLIERAETAA
ncbi:MAG: glycosyltransferase [Rhodobacteraceae bacterium]|nr:glycosyltransferase [Paracoccaceae bacterium]